jgi:hypothetical protein
MNALRRLAVCCALALCALWLAPHVRAQHVDLDAAFSDDDDGTASSDTESNESSENTDSSQGSGDSSDSGESDSEPAAEPSEGEAAAPAAKAPAVDVRLSLGGGIGTRAFLRPTTLGAQRLNDVLFPALDVGLAVHVWPQDSFSLGMLLRYQSSVGLEIEEQPLFALSNSLDARAERLEVSVAPTFLLGDSPSSVALGFPIGFGMRTFWPEANEFRTPGYSLAGPMLRAELSIPFGDSVGLRLGPELLWAVALDDSLTSQGVGSQAIAIGGELALHFQLGAVLGIELCYRESHAFASTTVTTALFEDVERFAVARLVGSL